MDTKVFKQNGRTVIENDIISATSNFNAEIDKVKKKIYLKNTEGALTSVIIAYDELLNESGVQVDSSGANDATVLNYITQNTVFNSASGGSDANPTSGVLPVNENGIFVDSSIKQINEKTGIGSSFSNPEFNLQVVNPNVYDEIKHVGSGDPDFNSGGIITPFSVGHGQRGFSSQVLSKIKYQQDDNAPLFFTGGCLVFFTSPAMEWPSGGDSSMERMRIDSSGNLGIGLSNPSEKLDVNGVIRSNGYKSSDGSEGITQTINIGGSNTLTIKNGIITAVN